MLRLSACGSIFATALTDHEVCTIAMGRDWKKTWWSRYTCDSIFFRTFIWVRSWCKDLSTVLSIRLTCWHSIWPRCGTMQRCGELSQESSEKWYLVRCHLWFSWVLRAFLIHWFTGSELVSMFVSCSGYYQWWGVALIRLVTVTSVHKLVTFILLRSWLPCSMWHTPNCSMCQ